MTDNNTPPSPSASSDHGHPGHEAGQQSSGATPPPYSAQHHGSQYQPQPPSDDPGRTLGIVGLVLSIFLAFIGFIVSLVAYLKSKRAGYHNTFALVGMVIGAILTVLYLFWGAIRIYAWNTGWGVFNPYNPFF